jgi:PleD family two-component response regulator
MRAWMQRFTRKPTKLLLVEPNASDATRLRTAIQSTYRIEVVSQGRQALDRLPLFHPDIVVTEIDLPDMNGIDLIRYAKSSQQYQSVVWVVATTHTDISAKVASFLAGASDHLVKPLNVSQIAVTLRNAFYLHELSQRISNP